jgi:hypothetical protein
MIGYGPRVLTERRDGRPDIIGRWVRLEDPRSHGPRKVVNEGLAEHANRVLDVVSRFLWASPKEKPGASNPGLTSLISLMRLSAVSISRDP